MPLGRQRHQVTLSVNDSPTRVIDDIALFADHAPQLHALLPPREADAARPSRVNTS